MNKSGPDFFNQEAARNYDEKNRKLAAISDCLHFLMGLVLRELPAQSRILCSGVGTGAEILSLAKTFPQWTFVAMDPSLPMIETCRERMKAAGLAERCEFIHGYVQDLKNHSGFDAALSVLVGHFVKREDRLSYYREMTNRLRTGGFLVNAEITFDLDSADFPSMLKNWEAVQTLMGATPESLAALPKLLRETLTVLPPAEVESLIRQSGVDSPLRFFRAMMICAWSGKKTAR